MGPQSTGSASCGCLLKFHLLPVAPGFPLCPQNRLSPCGLHFPRALFPSHLPVFGGLRLSHRFPRQPTCPVADCTEGDRHLPPPPAASSACHSPAHRGRGRAITRKTQAKLPRSNRAAFFFFFKGSDVTMWWQETHPVSFPSSHNNPAPENLPLRAQNISLHHVKMRMKLQGFGPNTNESSQGP